MCTFLVLMIPATADLAHAQAVAREFGFEPQGFTGEPHLPETHGGARLFDPDGAMCACGTSVGRSYREPRAVESIERKARRGRRARWSEAKRANWIEEQLAGGPVAPNLSGGADPELDRWLAFAEAAKEDSRIGRIGVVVQEFNERVSHWQPAVEVPANLQSLQMVARVTPTWLV